MRALLLSLIAVAFVFVSCKKYPDGPDISLRSKTERLANTWQIDVWFENGVNKTTDAKNVYKDYTMIIDKAGSYSTTFKWLGILPHSESGTWSFNGDKSKVVFTKTTPEPSTTSEWTILKLMENDLWGQFEDSSKVIKVQLKPY